MTGSPDGANINLQVTCLTRARLILHKQEHLKLSNQTLLSQSLSFWPHILSRTSASKASRKQELLPAAAPAIHAGSLSALGWVWVSPSADQHPRMNYKHTIVWVGRAC